MAPQTHVCPCSSFTQPPGPSRTANPFTWSWHDSVCCHSHTLLCSPMPRFCGEMLPPLHSLGLLRLQPALEISHGLCNRLTLYFSVLTDMPRLLQASTAESTRRLDPALPFIKPPTRIDFSCRSAGFPCFYHLMRAPLYSFPAQRREGKATLPHCARDKGVEQSLT